MLQKKVEINNIKRRKKVILKNPMKLKTKK